MNDDQVISMNSGAMLGIIILVWRCRHDALKAKSSWTTILSAIKVNPRLSIDHMLCKRRVPKAIALIGPEAQQFVDDSERRITWADWHENWYGLGLTVEVEIGGNTSSTFTGRSRSIWKLWHLGKSMGWIWNPALAWCSAALWQDDAVVDLWLLESFTTSSYNMLQCLDSLDLAS